MYNIVAIVTPYYKNGKINWNILNFLIIYHIFNKNNNILFLGTTGESNIFKKQDYFNLSKFIINYKINCFFGVNKNSINDIINICFILKMNNVIAILLTPISFILPNNLYVYKYYKIISKVGIPIIFYNIPKRTGIIISNFLIKKLSNKIIFSVKNSYNKKNNLLLKKNNIIIFIGEDTYLKNGIKLKFSGSISVIINLLPKYFKYIKIININFIKNFVLNKNPIFIKYILFKNCLINNFIFFFDINNFYLTQSQI
ncbi:dihydrodipicolinate synthase family protein [Candidatus Carsonella ruddii]|uniref:Dihydrodipicolinate synthase n=1 Tax=Candidatus Carsonella ruddii PC isolate NHV TaxID=1202540 RepID=J3YQS3_CARRU|nr:dihydrodipicolinate synthase family protein [Candidatus Carsonella ruddii]AFP84333.1 dihydrodipicolinate synthase [Candidatus Carsonella ruddii PC isolate NHV]